MRLRTWAAGLAAVTFALAGCGSDEPAGGGGGRLSIATGDTSGVYYAFGTGYARIISERVDGYRATADATSASVENITRVVRGDSDLGLVLADTATDAVNGEGEFAAPQPIRALARLYDNATQVLASTSSGISTLADLRGHVVSTGPDGSGTRVLAERLITAAGLDPAVDIDQRNLSLSESTAALADGTIDAMIWSGGLPTDGITSVLDEMGDAVRMVDIADTADAMRTTYGDVYVPATIPAAVYGLPGDVGTISVPNLLIVRDTMSDDLAFELTQALFDGLPSLTEIPEVADSIDRGTAREVEPLELHPGAARYYDQNG